MKSITRDFLFTHDISKFIIQSAGSSVIHSFFLLKSCKPGSNLLYDIDDKINDISRVLFGLFNIFLKYTKPKNSRTY